MHKKTNKSILAPSLFLSKNHIDNHQSVGDAIVSPVPLIPVLYSSACYLAVQLMELLIADMHAKWFINILDEMPTWWCAQNTENFRICVGLAVK